MACPLSSVMTIEWNILCELANAGEVNPARIFCDKSKRPALTLPGALGVIR
jgi:hypothetical protein